MKKLGYKLRIVWDHKDRAWWLLYKNGQIKSPNEEEKNFLKEELQKLASKF